MTVAVVALAGAVVVVPLVLAACETTGGDAARTITVTEPAPDGDAEAPEPAPEPVEEEPTAEASTDEPQADTSAETDAAEEPEPEPSVDLVVTMPGESGTVRRPSIVVRGTAVRGARVTVNGKRVPQKGRRFETTVQLERGANSIVVVARKRGHTEGRATFSIRRELTAAERAELRERRRQAFIAAAKTIPYGELIKDADRFAGRKVKYYGEILQVQESGGVGFMLLYTEHLGYDVWTDHIWVNYEGRVKGVEGDELTVYGIVRGFRSYETQIGGETFVPEIDAVYIVE